MKTNAELDKWAAEKCGVTEYDGGNGYFFDGKNFQFYEWTLSDARCREIVRECLEINTWLAGGIWFAASIFCLPVEGKSIEAAEIAGIQAIKDAEGE